MTGHTSLAPLFRPRSVALVGVPGDLSRPGGRVLKFLQRHGYTGEIYVVNPRHREVGGFPTYPSLAALPKSVDVAWIGLPATQASEVVRACGSAGVRFAIVLGAGFAEAGDIGEMEQARLVDAARVAGVRLIGPNTVGFINAWDRVALTFSAAAGLPALIPGPVALLSQSGGLGGALLNRATDRSLGVGLFVSTGNEADLTLGDCLEWLVEDERTRAVACLIEQVRAPERLARAVRHAVERGVAVVAVKLGTSVTGARAARSHTGAIVGRSDTWRAWARTVGILEVSDADQLVETAACLARTPPLKGNRAGIVTSSGGMAVMVADALEPRGFAFPPLDVLIRERVERMLPPYATVANPLDITAAISNEMFGEILQSVVDDPGLDIVIVPLTMTTDEAGRARAERVLKATHEGLKPVCVCWMGGSLVRDGVRTLEEAQTSLFYSVPACAAALGAVLEFRALCQRSGQSPSGVPLVTVPAPDSGGALRWGEVRALLSTAALHPVPDAIVHSEAEARAVATTLSFPAVVKLLGPLHKTEAGGVRVGLRDVKAVSAAVRDLAPRGDGCLIQPMIEGVEVLVGALRDPVLGPFVVVAPGGTNAELYRERAVRPAPINLADAAAMLTEMPGLLAKLNGYRGADGADVGALLHTVVRVAALARALGGRLRELDLNPVIVGRNGTGATIVDARIILEDPEP